MSMGCTLLLFVVSFLFDWVRKVLATTPNREQWVENIRPNVLAKAETIVLKYIPLEIDRTLEKRDCFQRSIAKPLA